jgi:nucleoside-diphosphate-sugar epimerase
MKLLVTGATGVLGRDAVPGLVAAGHDVVAATRDHHDRDRVPTDARPIRLDLFDPIAVREAVRDVDGVVHLATAIPPLARMHRRRAWAANDRLRAEATGVLVDAAIASGTELFVFPSISFTYADGGDAWLDEEAPIDPPFGATESALVAERHVQRLTRAGGRGVVLRLARLYGPGRASEEQIAQARAGRNVVVGSGDNHVSSLHRHDAGRAIAAAIDVPAGVYNVAEDRPTTAAELAEAISEGIAGPAPRRLPVGLARLLVGRASRLLTVSQRISNRRFRRASGWSPKHPEATAWWRHQTASAVDDASLRPDPGSPEGRR